MEDVEFEFVLELLNTVLDQQCKDDVETKLGLLLASCQFYFGDLTAERRSEFAGMFQHSVDHFNSKQAPRPN